MSLPTGTRLGPYEIVAPLGAGGMGDVYRGRDTRLERNVAIKVLSAHLATDPQFRLRFEREARAISSLEHPNICTLFDVGEQGDISYLVMPLLDGETLADRLSGPGGHDRALPVREALRIAIEIASAIEAAHEHGIIHRDLKPANIFVLRDGTAKILDFGLAKDSRSASGVATHETTIAEPTEPGIILGTAAYMAPEQVRGLSIDKRTDIWAFGCVLYQMLAGRRPFAGQTPSDVMAAILEREPDWTALPPSLPDGVVRVLRRCLRKDTRDRLHDIADARIEIQDARDQPESTPAAATPPSSPSPDDDASGCSSSLPLPPPSRRLGSAPRGCSRRERRHCPKLVSTSSRRRRLIPPRWPFHRTAARLRSWLRPTERSGSGCAGWTAPRPES